MSRWEVKTIGEICEINPRLSRDHSIGNDQQVSFVPMAAIDEVSGTIQDRQERPFSQVRKGYTHFKNGDVLFAKITPCMENGKAAIASNLTGGLGFGSTEFHVLRAKNEVLPEWLFYFVRQSTFRADAKRNFTGTAGQQRVPTTFLSSATIPVPPLAEQRQIVDLLSRAEGIVRLRREAQAKAQAIIPALFVEMFGDPSTNPKGWTIRTIRDLVARFEGGKNLQAGSEDGTPYRILKVSAVTSGHYLESESKPAPAGYEPPSNHLIQPGDMLFSRANTQELVGATAIVAKTNGKTLLPDKLWRFIWNEEVDQAYMHALFQNRYVRGELGTLSTGTSASMRNISQEKLFRLRLPVAPLPMQRTFGRYVENLRSVLDQQALALQKAEQIFESILAQSFAGESKPVNASEERSPERTEVGTGQPPRGRNSHLHRSAGHARGQRANQANTAHE
ncbi:restriction endonuclease subunit S [Burkholderia gladioli]|uniref:restriction endonuclease subunit S n=1 Tax=Burkholderia gladioli TaxID=28095 RepID=UPI001C223319|nr:restriction endonuclease subunit S [Burkholderia gladioli]MBU9171547.1 restriction endonuclease subunit S [Burkholderia gladioli]